VDPSLDAAAVPEFLLQPLVENALRHGLARRESATRLEVAARREGGDLVLTVTDDGPGPSEAPNAPRAGGVGLANTRERLAALYGERASVELARTEEGGARAIVRLPYREIGADRG
jgi:LytS/YehU family sensor histidine kinase